MYPSRKISGGYTMNIIYKDIKELPCSKLHELFVSVGWSEKMIPEFMLQNFNKNFINSTNVFSAWDEDCLVGCVRVLIDQMFRSIIYDLEVHPRYQKRGIGSELVKRCISLYPDSEWLVETENANGFYETLGFKVNQNIFLSIPCKWFK